jgi:hypothetical protein
MCDARVLAVLDDPQGGILAQGCASARSHQAIAVAAATFSACDAAVPDVRCQWHAQKSG